MDRKQIENVAKKAADDYLGADAPTMEREIFTICLTVFVIQQVNAVLDEAAKIVETKTISKSFNKAEIVERRKDQQSITAIEIAKEIRALKIK